MKALVAIDGSKEAKDALSFALDIADAMDGSVTAVHAVDPMVLELGGDEPLSGIMDAGRRLVLEGVEKAEERGERHLDEAVAVADERGHKMDTQILYGDPNRVIPDYAEDEEFDVIYVGHRGRSERAGIMLGSVAKGIVERARLPVTVVR